MVKEISMRLKIRTKLILSFFTPIIPLVAIVIIIMGYILNNIHNEAQNLDAISKEKMKIADLRLSLDRAVMPVNDYIITGDRKYIEDFKAISRDLERGLKEVEDMLPHIEEMGIDFDDEVKEEREILKDVKDAWQNVREIAIKIYAIPDPVGNKDAARLMEEMDYRWAYPAVERLKRWREIDIEEYEMALERHERLWMRLWTIIIIVSLSFPILCLLYIFYYSSQFGKSIDALKDGAKIIADGNLSYHIDLHTGDEIEELSALFNNMADNLNTSYTSLEDRVMERTRELKKSEERYKVLLKAVPDIMFRLSKDGIFLDFKGEERELYVPPDAFIGKKISDVLTREVVQKATYFMEEAIKTDSLQTFEYQLPMPEGVQDYEARLIAIEDGFLAIVRNISESKRLKKELQNSFYRLSTLYNIDRSVAQSLDLNEILNNALSMTLKTLEIEGGAITLIDPDGKTMTIRTHKGISEEFVNAVRHINIDEGISGRAVRERRPVILNISEYPTERLAPFIIKEGFQTLASTPLISAGKVFGALTLATHKIKAFPHEEIELLTSIGIQIASAVQNALLYQSVMISEKRFRGLVESSTDAIVSVNDRREIIQWNDSASKLFGYSEDEVMGKLIDVIIPEEYQNRHIEGFRKYIETGEGKLIGKSAELKGLRKDGLIVSVELSLSALKIGKSYIFTGIIRDLTERKRAEQEIIQQEKLATMGQLISGITHEIKNPLNIISGNVQILDMDEQDTEKKKIYTTVLQQVDRSVKIIDNLLGFARRKGDEIKDVSINNLIESTIRLVEYEMKLENITFIRGFEKDLSPVKADADQIAQVFLNLINNARDSMNEKQKRIKSGKMKDEGWKGEVRITTKKTDNEVEITFTDTGLGIPEDKVANMFKPFFTTKAEGKGTGLGLSITKDIVGKHGGKIELENRAGEGVKFIITLPISSPL